MARRASSGLNPGWWVAVGVLAVAAIAGGYFVFSKANDPYRTISTLDPAVYLENANSLRGNIYRVSGTVWNSLGWSPSAGRLFAIEVGEGRGTELLPLLVPTTLSHANLQKGQRFTFEVEVGDAGVLRVRSLRKE